MEKKIVLLPLASVAATEKLTGWRVRDDGATSSITVGLQEMNQSMARELKVIVPAAALAWHKLKLPIGIALSGDARLLPVLQHLLEENLLEEPEKSHVALPPNAQSGADCVVVVCDRQWLGEWLALFEQGGIRIGQIIPEVTPERLVEAAVFTGRDNLTWISCLQQQIPVTFPLESADALPISWERCVATAPAYAVAAKVCGGEHVRLLGDIDYLELLLQTRWDLAQHEWASTLWQRTRRKWTTLWREWLRGAAWQPVRVATCALIAVCALGLNAQAYLKAQSLRATKALMDQTLQATFPHVKLVVDAPLQMQKEVQALRSRSGALTAQDMLPMLSALGPVLHKVAQHPQSIEYVNGVLVLHGMPGNAAQLLNTELLPLGYSASPSTESVQMRWKEPGAI